MKCPYIFVLALFFSVYTFGQDSFKKAVFKSGNPTVFLAKAFTTLSGSQNTGSGTIIISFTLTKDGKIENTYPVKFDTQKNAINAILAIQKTNGLWSTTQNNGSSVGKKYKIAFNFVSPNSSYELDVKMADKFSEKKQFKQALKYYNKAIKSNKNEAFLYLKRAEIRYELEDMDGLKSDYLTCKTLQKEFLANVQLGVAK